MEDYLEHHGILGQRWGIRNEQRNQARLERKDEKWATTKGEKIRKKTQKKVMGEMDQFVRSQLVMSYTPNGKVSSKTILQFNNKLADLMNKQIGDISAPSGRVLRFVAKRGQMGVHTAVADAGYDLNQLNKGVFRTGKVAYKNENLMDGS